MQQSAEFRKKDNLFLKSIIVAALVLAMTIPGCFVNNLVKERAGRQAEVVAEVSSKWAGKQSVTGPVLVLPYNATVRNKDGAAHTETRYACVLPDQLNITGHVDPVVKKRGLYSVALYRSALSLNGRFGRLPLEQLGIDRDAIQWQKARIVVTTSDTRGIDSQVQMTVNNTQVTPESGIPGNSYTVSGISALIPAPGEDGLTFAISLRLKGSGELFFSPAGKNTVADISSPWKDPAFNGAFLPETSDITTSAFHARWHITPLANTTPAYWKDTEMNLGSRAFGVDFIQSVDGYKKTSRSVKYCLLFIALTFASFFFCEVLQRLRVHPVQYMLTGLALIIFYVLLLSLSEYTGFNIAYGIAGAATITLIAAYVHTIFGSVKTSLGITGALVALYGYIFVILQSEDYALLSGSIGLFIILAVLMRLSRRINWYGGGADQEYNSHTTTTG